MTTSYRVTDSHPRGQSSNDGIRAHWMDLAGVLSSSIDLADSRNVVDKCIGCEYLQRDRGNGGFPDQIHSEHRRYRFSSRLHSRRQYLNIEDHAQAGQPDLLVVDLVARLKCGFQEQRTGCTCRVARPLRFPSRPVPFDELANASRVAVPLLHAGR